MENGELLRADIYGALNKPNLILGGERELMLFSGLISTMLVFLAMTFITVVIGSILWLFLSTVLRMMAKADPYMSKVYRSQLHHQKYYPAHSTPFEGN